MCLWMNWSFRFMYWAQNMLLSNEIWYTKLWGYLERMMTNSAKPGWAFQGPGLPSSPAQTAPPSLQCTFVGSVDRQSTLTEFSDSWAFNGMKTLPQEKSHGSNRHEISHACGPKMFMNSTLCGICGLQESMDLWTPWDLWLPRLLVFVFTKELKHGGRGAGEVLSG